MLRFCIVLLTGLSWTSFAYAGQFVGTLEFTPKGCESSRDCRLVYDFGYIDSHGIGWQSSANDKTDGATIPSWAQGIIGSPFEKDFIKAAVIHDHYCDRNVRSWRETHWVLLDALLASGVPKPKANIMYYAVLIGGPKWVNLIPGEACQVGKTCVKFNSGALTIPDAVVLDRAGIGKIAFRPSLYNQPWFETELEKGEKALESSGQSMSPEQIEALAKANRPDDFFLNHGDAIKFEDAASRFPNR